MWRVLFVLRVFVVAVVDLLSIVEVRVVCPFDTTGNEDEKARKVRRDTQWRTS